MVVRFRMQQEADLIQNYNKERETGHLPILPPNRVVLGSPALRRKRYVV